MRFYALIEVNIFDGWVNQNKEAVIAASSSSIFSDVPVKTLSGNDFYIFEIDSAIALVVEPLRRRIIDESRLREILESGVYTDPFKDIDGADITVGTTEVELTTGNVIGRKKIRVRNLGFQTVFIGPTGVGTTFNGQPLGLFEEETYEYDSTQKIYGVVNFGSQAVYVEEIS